MRCGQTVRQLPVKERIAGSIPATAALNKKRGDKPTGDGNRLESGRAAMPWEFDFGTDAQRWSLPPSRALGRAAKALAFQAGGGEFDSRRALFVDRGSANGRPPVFEAGYGGSSPSPRTSVAMVVSQRQPDPGQLLLVVTPGSEPGGRWFDSNPRNFFDRRKPSGRMRNLFGRQAAAKKPLAGSSPAASAFGT